MISILLLPLFLAAAPPAPAAWSYDGHRLICDIAWRELSADAQRKVRELLALDPAYDRFADACVWPDEIRREPRYARYVTAHYVNVPEGTAGLDMRRDCGVTYCVVAAIRELTAVLADPEAPAARRLEALKFVGHFVGDIHQPLHAGRPGDRGGNDTPVRLGNETVNLHWVWDGVLLERMGLGPGDAARLHAMIRPVDRARWNDLDPAVWADESYQIVEHQAYRDIQDGAIDERYVERNRYTIERQILKAGVRLGALLNRLLGG